MRTLIEVLEADINHASDTFIPVVAADAGVIVSDVDECRDSHGGCEHECVNSQGSYQCVCHEGYTLRSDRHTCERSNHICT